MTNVTVSKIQSDAAYQITDNFWIALNPQPSLAEMVAAGNYAWIDPNILRLPISLAISEKQVERHIEFFRFLQPITSPSATYVIEAQGYRPATFEEMLALGAIHPHLQRQNPIVGLGTSCTILSAKRVPCLTRRAADRLFALRLCDEEWGPEYRFAVLKRESRVAAGRK